MQYAMTAILLAAFIAYFIWMKGKTNKMMADAAPAMQRFFEHTGYRYAHMKDAPLDAHVQLAVQAFKTPAQETTYVRDFHGLPITYSSGMKTTNSGYQTWCFWSAPLSKPRVLLQIADKSLSSVGKAVKEAFSNTTRHWNQEYPTAITSGDPAIDARFNIFGPDNADAVRAVLQTPGLKDMLLGCAEVDICVRENEVVYNDPSQKLTTAGAGGYVGSMAMGLDIGKRLESTYPVHEQVAQALATFARATK
jgi:hypothetical protein